MPPFIKAALQAIPHVVGDTRAVIAYVAATIAWMVVALKVQRNKNLLSHLKKLPERDRLEALRMEMGSVPVPNAITATEFLKSRVHTYYFWAFVILCVLLSGIGALALSYRSSSTTTLEKALEADRHHAKEEASEARVTEAEDKIENLRLRRLSDYYVQEFGQPSDKGTFEGVTYFIWIEPFYELDMAFVHNRSTEYCVLSASPDFKPTIPGGDSVKLGDKVLKQLADTYLYSNYGSAGGSTIVQYGLNGSHADDYQFGYVAYSAFNAEYPPIPGTEHLPSLKDDSGQEDPHWTGPINAFAVTISEQDAKDSDGPLCLQLPYWHRWE